MDGQARTTGGLTQTITLNGKEYTLCVRLVGQERRMEDYVLSLRDDPIDIASKACAKVPSEMHEAIWSAAIKQASRNRVVSSEEMEDFRRSIQGTAYMLWDCIQEHHKEEVKTPEDALALMENEAERVATEGGQEAVEAWLAGLQLKIQVASGEEDLGNSSGPS